MTVTHKLFKILSGYDVANGRTDGQTDGRTPYHNTSEVSLRAYKKWIYLHVSTQFIVNVLKTSLYVQMIAIYSLFYSCPPIWVYGVYKEMART